MADAEDIKKKAMQLEPQVLDVRALPELIAGQLSADEEITDCAIKAATALGENYGSTALALNITIRNKKEGSSRSLQAFCKMLPTDLERRQIFNVDVTFVKELQMYTLVVPAMLQLQRDCGVPEEDLVVHFVPRCYGARCSLIGDAVDEDAAIVLEDLRQRGFGTGNRVVGLDLAHTKTVLEKLATFQALAVALRIKRPQVYADTVGRSCCDFQMGQGKEDFGEDGAKFLHAVLYNVDKSPETARYRDAVEKVCQHIGFGPKEKIPAIREPFASILHNDLWTNNVMVRTDESGKPSGAALIDFQVCRINSPFKDVLFFLFTSVPTDVIAAHLEELIEMYHASFCRCLTQVGVDTTPFSLAAAWEDINAVVASELMHIMFMLRVINADPAMIRANPETFIYMPELGGDRFVERLKFVVPEFAKRGWLNV